MDIDPDRIKGTKKNLKWISTILENPRKISSSNYKMGDISNLSTVFDGINFDGIISEPFLLPFYRKLPVFEEVSQIMESTVIPSYEKLFSEGKEILKSKRRIVVTSPAVETLDGGKHRIPLKSISSEYGFKSIAIYGPNFIREKTDESLQLFMDKNMLYDDKSEIIRREFHVFEKS
jgi:hypothetical protein